MQVLMGCLIGLCVGVCASAEPLLEGRVRLESGEPVADAQVRLFDLTDLRRETIARAQTDDTGYFALPLAALAGSVLPEGFTLGPNYPNPFNPSTIIPYQLATASQVRLEVFNLLGQRLTTLVDEERPAGFHTATWYATDATGHAVGAGVYIYRMTVGAASQTGRMVLIDGQAGVAAAGAASDWLEASDSGGLAKEEVYGLIVEGSGLVYVDSSFRVEAGMAPVELVVSAGPYSAGKAADGALVSIPDANLRAAIARICEVGTRPLTVANMKTLTGLDLEGGGFRDLTGLEYATNLKFLWLDYNWITDVSPLKGLTNLEVLRLNYNSITDVSPLKGLTKLKDLGLRRNPLSVSSVNDHIAALERRGVTVSFDPPLRESDFDIELVFLDDFTENQKWVIQYAARRWMSIIREDLPDYEFTQGWSGTCGDQSYRIPAGEQIDDLRIYVVNQPNEFGSYWGGPRVVRTTPHLPVLGCISVGGNLGVTLHEIGHVLGIGTFWNDRGFLQDPNGDPHFNGPRAIAAFNDAGGRDYADAKVPVEEGGRGALSHWRSSVFQGELMDWTYGLDGIGPLSAITVAALADLGYVVDVTQADPYTLPGAAAKASAKVAAQPNQAEPKPVVRHRHHQQREPIYVVDPQGNIVRTIGD